MHEMVVAGMKEHDRKEPEMKSHAQNTAVSRTRSDVHLGEHYFRSNMEDGAQRDNEAERPFWGLL